MTHIYIQIFVTTGLLLIQWQWVNIQPEVIGYLVNREHQGEVVIKYTKNPNITGFYGFHSSQQ